MGGGRSYEPKFAPLPSIYQKLTTEFGIRPTRFAEQWYTKEVQERAALEKVKHDSAPIPHFEFLRDHQNAGVRFFVAAKRVLCADDTGVGKTMQAMVAAHFALNKSNSNVILIVTLRNVSTQWEDEIEKWLLPKFPGYAIHNFALSSSKRIDKMKEMFASITGRTIVIINWDALDSLEKEAFWNKRKFAVVIGDEAHAVKNRDAKRTKAMSKLVQRTEHLYLLTGTPVEKYASDMWTLLHMLRPQKFSSFWVFHNAFVYKSVIDPKETHAINVPQLHELLDPHYIRRLRSETIGTEEPVFQTRWVLLSPEERKFYDEIEDYVLHQLNDENLEEPKYLNTVLQMLTAARQAAISPCLVKGKNTDSSKISALTEFIDDELPEDEFFLVYCSYRAGVELIARRLGSRVVPYYAGQTDPKRLLDFNNGKLAQGLVATPESIGTGTNLQIASTIYYIDVPWRHTLYRQSWGRIVRPGQKHTPMVYRICAKDTVDSYITETIIGNKEELFNSVVISSLRRRIQNAR